MCPDIDYMGIQNLILQQVYSGYTYELAYCDIAALMIGYEDLNCENDHSVAD
jgi:hypothetical protein